MKLINFSIIIPNFNGANFLPDCQKSLLLAIMNCPNSKFEIILVDNASKDNSIDLFTKLDFSPKKIIALQKNFGFALAVNKGIEASTFEYVVICNNDLTISPDWFKIISHQINQNKDEKVVTFFGLVLNKDGKKIESQGLEFFIKGKALNINNGQPFIQNSKLIIQNSKIIWGASASLVVYKKNALEKVGSFDPDFFAYEEDVDLAYRLNYHGYKTLYVPTAISFHLGGGTSSRMGNFRNRMDAKNWIYIILKNYPLKTILKNLPQIIVERLRNCSGLIKNTPIYLLPYYLIATYLETIIHIPGMLAKRKMLN